MNEQNNIDPRITELNNNINEVPKPKKSPVKGIIIVLQIIVIIGLVGYIFYNKDNKETPKEEQKVVTDGSIESFFGKKEKEITDKDVIAKIEEKDQKLDYYSVLQQIGVLVIKDDYRLIPMLEYLSTTDLVKDSNIEEFNELMGYDNSGEVENTIKKIDGADVSREFKNMYGYEPKELYVIITFDGKTVFESAATNGKDIFIFDRKENPDGEIDNKVKRMNIKYTEDENYYYIYFNAGIVTPEATYYSLRDQSFLMYNKIEKVKAKEIEQREQLKMDESNASDFSIIKVSYKKSGSDFYFDKVEYVKE